MRDILSSLLFSIFRTKKFHLAYILARWNFLVLRWVVYKFFRKHDNYLIMPSWIVCANVLSVGHAHLRPHYSQNTASGTQYVFREQSYVYDSDYVDS